jgi:hypothetical protein
MGRVGLEWCGFIRVGRFWRDGSGQIRTDSFWEVRPRSVLDPSGRTGGSKGEAGPGREREWLAVFFNSKITQ